MLRHGEQLLLNLVIPAAILLGSVFAPFFGEEATLNDIVPMVFSVAAASAGFTGQAIALAFDRRYGALKRTGASGVPAWTIIAGKIIAVFATVLIQIIVLGGLSLILGWSVSFLGVVLGLCTLFIGVTAFASLGLLMGGTLSSEVVLACANLIWLVLFAVLGWVVYSGHLGDPGFWDLVPSVALASAMNGAVQGSVNATACLSLIAWAAVSVFGASRWFGLRAKAVGFMPSRFCPLKLVV